MAGAKEIRTKIASVRNTQKITKAMEMVAASKMRKTQERMSASRPYADSIRKVISHIAKGNIEYQHPFLISRPVKKVGYLVVSTDRGLCGGLNINLFKTVLNELKEKDDQGIKSQIGLVGNKGISFFNPMGLDIKGHINGLGDTPTMENLVGIVNGMVKAFREGEIDEVYVVYNRFVNTMSQKPTVQKLLPLPELENDSLGQTGSWDYIYEPSPQALLDSLLVRYLESQVYQAVVDNLASEQAARMVAMKAATDNAGNLINELQLVYNKARQASITNELNEIVAGAAAI